MDCTASAPLFRMEGVSKRYGGVNALTNADLIVEAGRIHGVLGENGAGKSTLMKIMAGVVQPDDGRMTLDGHAAESVNDMAHRIASATPGQTITLEVLRGGKPLTVTVQIGERPRL